MAQIEELEQRITAAFSRISAGVLALSTAQIPAPSTAPVAPGDDALARLQAALDDEHMANAQLTERLRTLGQQGTQSEASSRAQVDSLTRQLDTQGLDVQRLTSTVAQLREDLRRLREAAEQGIVDPSLINRAMMAELEAMRTARTAESNEMNDILSALGGVLDTEEARAHA